ncbi:MAG: HNH endonuclease [Cyanobacteria bacterium SZAS LIN-2]|nr:HNH endonuclease [Cyanobacteria bacterium SZAS LIN-2]
MVALGQKLDEAWMKLPPREQERLRAKMVSELVAGSVIPSSGVAAVGKVTKFSEILDVVALESMNAHAAARGAGHMALDVSHKGVQAIKKSVVEFFPGRGGGLRPAFAAEAAGSGEAMASGGRTFLDELSEDYIRRLYRSPKTGRVMTPGSAAADAGIKGMLTPVEKMQALIAKGWQVIEPKAYHVAGIEGPLTEAAMANRLKVSEDTLRAMSSAVLKDKGITVIEPVDGRLPVYWGWAGKYYPFAKLHPVKCQELCSKYPKMKDALMKGVRYTENGYPDFEPFSLREVQLEHPFGTRADDFLEADKLYWPSVKTRADGEIMRKMHQLTWHHVEAKPGQPPTLQLVPRAVHEAAKHTGGIAAEKGRKGI